MDNELQSNLEEDYELRLMYIENLKKSFSFRLLTLKAVFLFLLLILVYEPGYLEFYSLLINSNKIYQGRYNILVVYYPFLFVLLAVIPILMILKGIFRLNLFFFLLGIFLIIFADKDYILWVIKFVSLFIFYKIPENYVKYSKSYNNYLSYKESYMELYTLKRTFDLTLKNYVVNIVRLLILSYTVIILFELISINLGTEVSVVLPLVLLPILTILLFLSPYIFIHVRRYYKKNNLPFFSN